MVQLPDWTALGNAPSGNSGRSISSTKDFGEEISRTMLGNAGAAGEGYKGLQAVGEGLAKVGAAGAAVGREQYNDELKLATARADAAWMPTRINRIKQFGDEDPDYDTAPKRFMESSPDAIKGIAEQYITDPRARELWTLKAQEETARDFGTIYGKSLTKRTAYDNAAADESLVALGQTYNEAEKDPASAHIAEEALKAANAIIDERLAKGAWTDEQATARRKQWALGVYQTSLANQDYPTQLGALGGFEKALRFYESRNNPTSQNQFGYSGLYQFGAPRLETLGVYKPGTNEDLKTWSDPNRTMANTPSKWTGYFDIPDFPSVKTIKDFLASPEAQRKVFQMHIADIDKRIEERGFDKFIGQNVQGVRITKEGIEAMFHLGGEAGTDAVLHGRPWKGDANGTTLIQYAKLGLGGQNGDPMANTIDVAHRDQMFDNFVDQHHRQVRQDELQTKEQVAAASGNYLTRALHSDFGTPEHSILDDIKNDPVLAKDPQAQFSLDQTIRHAQDRAAKGKAKDFGPGYNKALDAVIAGDLRDYRDVLKLSALDDNAPDSLTEKGADEIWQSIQRVMQSPAAHSREQIKQSLIKYAEKQLVIDNPYVPSDKDEVGANIFNGKFVPTFLDEYEKFIANPKNNPMDFLNTDNIDKMIKGMRDPTEMAQRRLAFGAGLGATTPASAAPANPLNNTILPAPAGVDKDNWQKLASSPPMLNSGRQATPYEWTAGLDILVSKRNEPPVLRAFGRRFPGTDPKAILNGLGLSAPETPEAPSPTPPAQPDNGPAPESNSAWAAPEELGRKKMREEEQKRRAREAKAEYDKRPPWQSSGPAPWEVR